MKLDNLPELALHIVAEVEPGERPAGYYLATRSEVLKKTQTGDFLAWKYTPDLGCYYNPRQLVEARSAAALMANISGESIFILEKKAEPYGSRGYESFEELESVKLEVLEALYQAQWLNIIDLVKHVPGIPRWSLERVCFDLILSGHIETSSVKRAVRAGFEEARRPDEDEDTEILFISKRGIGYRNSLKAAVEKRKGEG